LAISEERRSATATYPAELVAVGSHLNGTLANPNQWFARPDGANYINLQILGSQTSARYRLDNQLATAMIGFYIGTGDVVLLPVSGTGISVAVDAGAPTYQAQWFR